MKSLRPIFSNPTKGTGRQKQSKPTIQDEEDIFMNSRIMRSMDNRPNQPKKNEKVKKEARIPILRMRSQQKSYDNRRDITTLRVKEVASVFVGMTEGASLERNNSVLNNSQEPMEPEEYTKLEIPIIEKLKILRLKRSRFEIHGMEELMFLNSRVSVIRIKLAEILERLLDYRLEMVIEISEEIYQEVIKLEIPTLATPFLIYYIHCCHRIDNMRKVFEATEKLNKYSLRGKGYFGLMISDYFRGMYYSKLMNREAAVKTYFRMLLTALFIRNSHYELLAYDLIGMQYFYLNKIEKSIFFHQKYVHGNLEPEDSMQRTKTHFERNYTVDENEMNEFLGFEVVKKRIKDMPGKRPLKISHEFEVKVRRFNAEENRKKRLFEMVLGQKKAKESLKDEIETDVYSDPPYPVIPNQIVITHLSIDRNIKPIGDQFLLRNHSEIDEASNERSASPSFNEELSAEATYSLNKSGMTSRQNKKSSNTSNLETRRKNVYKSILTHNMVFQMNRKIKLNNYDSQFLRNLIPEVQKACEVVIKVVSECSNLHYRLKNSYCKISDKKLLRFKVLRKEVY